MRAVVATVLSLFLAGCFFAGPDPEAQKRAQAEHDLALDAFQRSSLREALAHVKKALDHDADNADAAYLGATILLVFCAEDASSPDCRFPEAEQLARQALAAQPEMRDARNLLAVVLVHRGEVTEAIALLEPLTQDMLYRSPEKSWGNLGWAYLEAGRTDAAIGALERSVAAQPLFCVGHYRLGLAFEKKGELTAARQALSRALGIKEGGCDRLQDALLARARIQKSLGAGDESRKDLEQCRDLASASTVGRSCAAALVN